MLISNILLSTDNFHDYIFVISALLILSFLISLVLSIYSFGIKENKNAFLFSVIMVIGTIWSFKRFLLLFISDLEFWGAISNVSTAINIYIPVLFLLIAVNHTKLPVWFRPGHIKYLFAAPILFSVLSPTASFHQLMLYDNQIKTVYSIPCLVPQKGPMFYFYLIYLYSNVIIAVALFVKSIGCIFYIWFHFNWLVAFQV